MPTETRWWRVWFGTDSLIWDGPDAWKAARSAELAVWRLTGEWMNATKTEAI